MNLNHRDQTSRKTLRFWSKFVATNDAPRQALPALLSRAADELDAFEAELVAVEQRLAYISARDAAILEAADTLQKENNRLRSGLRQIVDNANSEPYAADYAKDILSGIVPDAIEANCVEDIPPRSDSTASTPQPDQS